MPPQIKNRSIPGDQSRDPSAVDLLSYNEKSGAKKSLNVGPALIPLGDGAGGYTTNATARKVLPNAGSQLAIYNNAGTVASVTVGDNTVLSQASGAVQVSGSNVFVGVPLPANSWTYLSSAQWQYVIASAATVLVFLIDDPTFIVVQPANVAST